MNLSQVHYFPLASPFPAGTAWWQPPANPLRSTRQSCRFPVASAVNTYCQVHRRRENKVKFDRGDIRDKPFGAFVDEARIGAALFVAPQTDFRMWRTPLLSLAPRAADKPNNRTRPFEAIRSAGP
jgi:hypothetical protein